jgi:signal transduction histidine kinase
LRQILINLLSNAIKYTVEGEIRLSVTYDAYARRVYFSVRDTGVGIPEDKYELIFSAFTKIMKDRKMNPEGCGLGLTISKNLANALGGDITFES